MKIQIGLVTAFLLAAMQGSAHALTVACGSGQTISAAIAKLGPSRDYQQITVTGACKDNIYVPPGLAVALIGSAGASLSPAVAGPATIATEGRLYIYQISIKTSAFAGVFVTAGGYATLVAGKITGSGTGLQVSNNSGALLSNQTIEVGGNGAINTYNNGTVEVDGLAVIGKAAGSSISSAGSDGIICASGTITLNASGGPISISNNKGNAIAAQGCSLTTYTSNGFRIALSKNKYSGVNAAQSSSITLAGVDIADNGGNGIYAQVSSGVQLSGGVTITGNANSAIQASKSTTVNIQSFAGVNTITAPASNTNVLFGCYQGGKIYADAIAGVITPAPTSTDIGCLTVGGP